MGKLANDARHHVEKIRHYHSNAGEAGYLQAKYHFDKLAGLKSRASSSKESGDLAVIQMNYDAVAPLMMEMEEREVALGEAGGLDL